MASLLKRKNYNTTKGTKRWRKNIDASELEDKVAANHQKKYIAEQVQEKVKKNETIGFTIDTRGDKKIRDALDKERFHKKIDESGISEQEMKKYRLIAKKMTEREEKESKKVVVVKEEKPTEIEEEDIWMQEGKDSLIERKQRIGHLVIPTSGMSYNPSFKDHQDVIEEAIALEDEDKRERTLTRVKKIRKQKKDLKEFERMDNIKKELKLNDVQRAKREERRVAHQQHIIKKVKKEFKKLEEQSEANIQTRRQQAVQEKLVKEKLGLNFKPEKLGIKKYRQKGQDFVLEEDLPDNLRSVQSAGSLLRDEYEAVFRKGLLEPKNYFKTDKKSKVPAIKFKQKFDPYFKSEWEDVETALSVNN